MSKKPVVFDGYRGDKITSFNAMKKAGIKLVVLKSSQGLSYADPAFEGFIDRAESISLLVGAYHFGAEGDGVRQAKRYMEFLRPGMLMVLDFERYAPSQMTLTQAEDFVTELYRRTGNYPVLYYGELLLELEAKKQVSANSILRKCPAWIARYGDKEPAAIKGQDLVMWQYTGDGVGPEPHRIDGVDNDADLSVWIGNEDDIPRFVAKHSLPKCKVGT